MYTLSLHIREAPLSLLDLITATWRWHNPPASVSKYERRLKKDDLHSISPVRGEAGDADCRRSVANADKAALHTQSPYPWPLAKGVCNHGLGPATPD